MATLRPPDPAEDETPLTRLRDTFRSKHLAHEIALEGLDTASVIRYVTDRIPPAPDRRAGFERLGRRVRRHTGGNPLFLANILDGWAGRQLVKSKLERKSAG